MGRGLIPGTIWKISCGQCKICDKKIMT
jgi:hypothetical protein